LFVGSGFRRKGLDQLLALWESAQLGRVFLLVVGADPRLERYRARADVIAPGRIMFAGRQDDIEKYYAAADVLALPSLQEGFGNVVLEGLAAGLPALVSRDVGAAEILSGALSRGVVDWDTDREEIAARLAALLEGARDSCSVPMARTLAEEYSWEKHFRRLEALLLQSSRNSNGGTS
jgi:UDP-glucose:(heptosyl)LPS alpha-1,3-glucosyltransferase